jgi:uncharacterized glyoxalase superfamily protein PhnB
MVKHIGLIALVVDDYDQAINFYVEKLSFTVSEDLELNEGKRWVVLSVNDEAQTKLLLAKADDETQRQSIGNQTGGRVSLFLYTDDFAGDYARMQHSGVKFEEQPRKEPYGIVVVFQDLYGNRWDLIELAKTK